MPMLNVGESNLFFTVKGHGIPIVFIHPPLLTSVNFEYQMEELSQHFQVITFDIRGHGKSEYSSKPITYPLIVHDIKQLLNHIGVNKAFICGYSTGASIALEFLLTASDRALGGIVISGMSEVSDWFLKQRVSLAIRIAKSRATPLLAWSICWSNSNTKKLFKKMIQDAKRGDTRNIVQYYHYSLNYNCTYQLRNIKFPILLIYGKKDRQFHRYASILHKKLPYNDLKMIENVDHRIPTKAAGEVNEIISRFIKQRVSDV